MPLCQVTSPNGTRSLSLGCKLYLDHVVLESRKVDPGTGSLLLIISQQFWMSDGGQQD